MTRFTTIEEINGQWFVCTDSTDINPEELRFQNRGNGVELVGPAGVEGPFESEQEAQAWLDSYLVEREIERIGLSFEDQGPVNSACVDDADIPSGMVRLYDDNSSAVCWMPELLDYLKSVPDRAAISEDGFNEFWQNIEQIDHGTDGSGEVEL